MLDKMESHTLTDTTTEAEAEEAATAELASEEAASVEAVIQIWSEMIEGR